MKRKEEKKKRSFCLIKTENYKTLSVEIMVHCAKRWDQSKCKGFFFTKELFLKGSSRRFFFIKKWWLQGEVQQRWIKIPPMNTINISKMNQGEEVTRLFTKAVNLARFSLKTFPFLGNFHCFLFSFDRTVFLLLQLMFH